MPEGWGRIGHTDGVMQGEQAGEMLHWICPLNIV